jgi:acyl-coenzyme A thioesterase PaaI-like protein
MSDETNGNQNPPEGFQLAPFNYGFSANAMPYYIKYGPEDAIVGFYVLDNHINPGQIAHGGMLMTIVDMAFGVNIGMKVKDAGFLPTMSLSYDFIKPAFLGTWIESKIEFINITKRTAVVAGYLIGPDGIILRANGTNKIMRKDDPRFQIDDKLKIEFLEQRSRDIAHD